MRHSKLPYLTLAVLIATGAAQASVFKDAQLQTLLDKDKTEELERVAQTRLKQSPADTQAAVALALLAKDSGDDKRVEAGVHSMEQCLAQQPKEAACHYALGSLLGVQAMSASMFKAMSLTGKIRDAFSRALEIDPGFIEARAALQQFYVMAPSVAGGSISKAGALAQEVRESQPELAKLMRSRVLAQDGKLAEAERELLSFKPGDNAWLNNEWRQTCGSFGIGYLQDKQWAKAKSWYEQLQQLQPQAAWGAYGLGRVATEQGQFDEAVKLIERARGLEGAEQLPIDYRLGVALQGKGDKAQAKAAFERYIASKRTNPRNLEDARKRLSSLG
ncbi:tetratricopeptide repeat protein [Paucibacter sp. APW11]|uniref:Tetratricopeptide repeat protein n=1 Tax=Roseateles aquae TaxID=3077235 RepID=A0ABU3PBB4_9BURK|nr:tetratricopeptide repeat protein [Paucibacter sp. APW11]MDT8999056.1 tetratricopeptide repeat protein [Paucibacter sp. APW11]